MNPASATYLPTRRKAEIHKELERARWGRAVAERMRHESIEQARDSARVARASGLSVAEIARASGVSIPRIYQLIAKEPHA